MGTRKKYLGGGLFVLIAVLVAARLYLNVWVLNYVNNSLSTIPNYKGSVESIDISLYRGAYTIHHLKINKTDAQIPTPFVDIKLVDLAIQWAALLHGRIVSDIELDQPVLNFAVSQSAKQTGKEADWTQPIKDLAPIDINRVTFKNGKLAYQDFSSTPQVNIYIHHMSGEARNLRNVVNPSDPLPSILFVKGDSIGGGNFEIKGRLNILQTVPDMDLAIKLENVSLPALNSYSNAYADLDFKAGEFSVYSEFIIKDSKVSGYVKPIARHISLVDLHKESNPVKVAWEALAFGIITIFTNQHTDQFATKVPLQGSLSNINTDTWSAIGGILSNAFVKAFRQGFDPEQKSIISPETK